MTLKLDEVEKLYLAAINRASNDCDLARELAVGLQEYRRYYKVEEEEPPGSIPS